MERLTTKIDNKYQLSDEFDYGGKYMVGYTLAGECGNEEYDEYPDYSIAFNKLGQFEDIMEKYNIESIEELEKVLSNHEEYQSALNVIKDKGSCGFCEHLDNKRIKVLEKALELACEKYDSVFLCPSICDKKCNKCRYNYFIEQAKKELGEKQL